MVAVGLVAELMGQEDADWVTALVAVTVSRRVETEVDVTVEVLIETAVAVTVEVLVETEVMVVEARVTVLVTGGGVTDIVRVTGGGVCVRVKVVVRMDVAVSVLVTVVTAP